MPISLYEHRDDAAKVLELMRCGEIRATDDEYQSALNDVADLDHEIEIMELASEWAQENVYVMGNAVELATFNALMADCPPLIEFVDIELAPCIDEREPGSFPSLDAALELLAVAG